MLKEIHKMMEENKCLKKLVPAIYTPFVRELRCVYLMNKEKTSFCKYYQANKERFDELMQMLEDDFSRETLNTVIWYRSNPRVGMLPKIMVQPQYFVNDILKPAKNEVFVDGGGYKGETIYDLFAWEGKNPVKKVYTWEPDEINRKALEENCRCYKNVEILPYGLWSEKTELRFSMDGYSDSRVSEDGKAVVKVDSIDNLCSKERITFIKMDIEGSEQEALRGAEKVICRDKPRLAICLYHSKEDLLEIPFLVKKMVPEYKIYIRHHSVGYNETVLYAKV